MTPGGPEPCERRRGWPSTVLGLLRAKPSLKLGVLLIVVTFSLSIYMMVGSSEVVNSSDLPPMEMNYHEGDFFAGSVRDGKEQDKTVMLGDVASLTSSSAVESEVDDVDLKEEVPGLEKGVDVLVPEGAHLTVSDGKGKVPDLVKAVKELMPEGAHLTVSDGKEAMPDLVKGVEELMPEGAQLMVNESSTSTTTTPAPPPDPKKIFLNYNRKGTAPMSCDDDLEDSGLLEWDIPKFLPNYRNPCWWEKIRVDPEDLYKNNGYANYSTTCKKMLDAVHEHWQKKDFSKPQYRLRCLPYFVLAGQPKCGSTDLYMKLISHPDIASPPTKEPHWWGKLRFGTIPFEDYIDLFDKAAMKINSVTEGNNESTSYHPVITGDFSVSTLWSNDGWWQYNENCGHTEPRYTSANYIHRLLPHTKVLVILRNPTDRLYSDFLYFQKSLKTQRTFHNEVTKSITNFKKCVAESSLRSCLYNYTVSSTSRVRLRVGMYALFLEEWMELFPRNQFLVLRLEDYSETPLASLRQVYKFLDLRTLTTDENEELLAKPKANTRREQDRKLGGMLRKTRILLDSFYRPFNQKLAHILQDKRFLWDPA